MDYIKGVIHAEIDDEEVQNYLHSAADIVLLTSGDVTIRYPGLAPMSTSSGCPSCGSSQVTAQATVLVATGQIVDELEDTRTCLDCEYEWEV